MGTREKLFRQKLANQIEALLTTSEKVFSTEKLDTEWLEKMLGETQELTSLLTIYQFLHELPENESLQVEFLELKEEEKSDSKPEVPKYGDEILKEIDEFESQEAEEVFVVEETVIEETIIEKTKETELIEEEEESSTEVKTDELIIEEAQDIESKTEEPKEEEEVVEDEQPEELDKPIVEDPIQEIKTEPKEINEAMALTETSLADKLRSKTIKKLAESIALNERFLFSNELFNGNMEAFKRALNELDHIASKEDAQRYIELQLQVENNWNLESDTVQSFITLVERRFN